MSPPHSAIDAIREPEPLQHRFGVADEHLELAIRLLGSRDVHELDLVELVLANHAARVLPVRSRLRAEARRVRRQAQRQPIRFDDRVAHEVRQRHLGRRNQAQLVLALEREQIRGELRQLARAEQRRIVDEIRHVRLAVAVLARVHVEHELRDRAMQAARPRPSSTTKRLPDSFAAASKSMRPSFSPSAT